jgi:hypothetical protein
MEPETSLNDFFILRQGICQLYAATGISFLQLNLKCAARQHRPTKTVQP